MRSLLDVSHKAKRPDNDVEVWCLNLDQIESHSGKVLSKLKCWHCSRRNPHPAVVSAKAAAFGLVGDVELQIIFRH